MIFTWSLLKAGVMQDTGSGQGTGQRLGTVGETTQCMDSLLISLLVWWIFQVWSKENVLRLYVGFFTLLKSFSPTLEVRKLACSITSSTSSRIFPWAHSSQVKSVSKPRCACHTFLLSSTPSKSNRALIFITCVKQPTPFYLLVWHWKYKLKLLCPQSLGEGLPGQFRKSSEIL